MTSVVSRCVVGALLAFTATGALAQSPLPPPAQVDVMVPARTATLSLEIVA